MERPNYKNWMPKGMIWSFAAACAVCLVLTLVIRLNWLRIIFLIATIALHDIFSRSNYGDMQAFVESLKGMGYERVELIPTDGGRFMTRWEATWMALSGSAVLVGKK